MIDFCAHLGDDWLDPEDLRDARQEADRDLDAQALEDDLEVKQPSWQHGLIFGAGGHVAVVSEKV